MMRIGLLSLFLATASFSLVLRAAPTDIANRVFLLVHGFSSSTFEWTEGKAYIEKHCTDCTVELVSLGKHGSLGEFRSGTWQEWGKPIFDTYQRLVDSGHRDITLVLSSAAASLVLENLSRPDSIFHKKGFAPRRIIFIDPLVKSRSQYLWLAPWLQYLPFNLDREKPNLTDGEKQNSFSVQPMAALAQLQNLCSVLEERLKARIKLPDGTKFQIFYSRNDPVVDPESVNLIKASLGTEKVVIQGFASDMHVFTRLRERDPLQISELDKKNQQIVFDEIIADSRYASTKSHDAAVANCEGSSICT